MRSNPDLTINRVGNHIVSLREGLTRAKGGIYEVILDPKTKVHDPNRMWYVGRGGYPVNCLRGKFFTYRQATEAEADRYRAGINYVES